ncbi:hypothetical protein [Deinococcus koreensis]|uniref:Uncharacterized protein n=1 Tax=Deinococcus koreensis TaxID=2054903 RepID=A0A2K3UYN6_9DEIO|nr:hypothetical protein [Deinococcus koreensis]PNY81642.1 hypothetical protein CVO96_09890 [Deinococcus koreensis]
MRYIITRPCLQEGSLRLLKYLESTFPTSGPAVFLDDKGDEHAVQVDRERGRVWGLGAVYHAQHLNVNDVLMITSLAPARYQVEAIVKPHAVPPAPRREYQTPTETRRVVISSTPHVREVRMQEVRPVPPTPSELNGEPRPADARPADARVPAEARAESPRNESARGESARPAAETARGPAPAPAPAPSRSVDVRFPEGGPASGRIESALGAGPALRPTPAPRPIPAEAEAQLGELARLTGYRLEELGGGVIQLRAELGTHAYTVLVARDDAARRSPAWSEPADYRVQITSELERPEAVARLTREALVALIEHARLAPLSPVDLRGYWKAGGVDLESAASVAELVSSHLAQRGAFSFVLLTLAQQPAHSVVSVQRLAERLGSGVNFAELGSILDTLSRAPFLALTPLPGGQYLLRVGVGDLLTDMAEYADGVRRRVRTPVRRDQVLV